MKFNAIQYVLPSRVVTNEEVVQQVREDSHAHLSADDLRRVLRGLRLAFRRMGTQTRYRRAEGERAFELCSEAGRKALRAAEMDPEQIDLLLYVGVGRGFIEPATANVFQDLLKLRAATCFDIMDACASWLRAIHVAQSFLQSGCYSNVMILNAEFNADYEDYSLRSATEFDYRFPAFTVGEAATATIVSDSTRDDACVTRFRSFGDQHDRCLIPLPNYAEYLPRGDEELVPMRFLSHGQEIMDFGLEKLVEEYQKESEFREFDPDIVFFHAASDAMSREGMRRCRIDEDIGYYTHHRFANTVSATIPLAMAAAMEDGSLVDGSKVMLAVASAGISTALSRFHYYC